MCFPGRPNFRLKYYINCLTLILLIQYYINNQLILYLYVHDIVFIFLFVFCKSFLIFFSFVLNLFMGGFLVLALTDGVIEPGVVLQ